MITEEELKTIEEGGKITKKAIRGKKEGANITIDLIGAGCARICKGKPKRMTASICYQELQRQKFQVKLGKPFSRGMVKTRLARLWEIGFIQQKSEKTKEGHTRHVYYIGPEEPQQHELVRTQYDPLKSKSHPYFEMAKSGRSSCKTCYKGIAKGTIRLVAPFWEDVNERLVLVKKYHHIKCYLESNSKYQVKNIIRVTEHKRTVLSGKLAKLIDAEIGGAVNNGK